MVSNLKTMPESHKTRPSCVSTPSGAMLGLTKPKKSLDAQIRQNPNPPLVTADLASIIRKWTQTPAEKAAIRAKLATLPKGSVLGWKGDKLEWQAPTTERNSAVAAGVDMRQPDPVAAGERTSGLVAVGYVDNDGVKITKGVLK